MAEIRVSSAERAEALTALEAHHASGRLSRTEYELRRRLATEARVRPELEILFEDLPAPHPDLSAAVAPRRQRRVYPEWPGGRAATRATRVLDVIGVLSLLVGLPAAIVATAVAGLWWTLVLVVGLAVVSLVLGVALMPPRPETEDHAG
ncbi:DUF1707 SHOCT-like domain-containing protein [Actinophytocola xanthii]|uniref:DUF1707 domain-containing protein n=1 Tax=Actinophytocola xanthii TaxID=1912961 RepID=A0A1Q8BUY5_9PSEU|nr:DUF1707 domain-containing protein [Actinophytocola xanthii]OLF05947.1 hypothetical protein BU204_36720 [Actinophytocola xanthii]